MNFHSIIISVSFLWIAGVLTVWFLSTIPQIDYRNVGIVIGILGAAMFFSFLFYIVETIHNKIGDKK